MLSEQGLLYILALDEVLDLFGASSGVLLNGRIGLFALFVVVNFFSA